MDSFIVYDLAFMIVFAVATFLLLYKHKKNLKRQGWIFLYHSSFGLKFIDWTAKKFEKILKPLQYIVIASGYILMGLIVWIMGLSVWKYVTTAIPEQLQNVPPIAPLIPYFPKLFGLESLFPPLYFTYFLIALAIVAISHEFSHGIFARLNGIKIKTTGLAFFGPFFGAFVEPDEKQMYNKKKFPQLVILAAGTFANVVMTVIFLGALALFFSLSFAPAGVNFNAYPSGAISVASVISINGVNISGLNNVDGILKDGLNEVKTQGGMYLAPKDILVIASETNAEKIGVFQDAPAIRAGLTGPIVSVNGVKITSQPQISEELGKYSPGDEVVIKSLDENGDEISYNIELADNDGRAYLGIAFNNYQRSGVSGILFGAIYKIRDPLVYYQPSWDGEFVQFIYDLLWWIVVINILVALFNMLPVSILDGGRFFYLTIWGITGRESWGKKAYKFTTWLILAALVLMMVRWVFGYF